MKRKIKVGLDFDGVVAYNPFRVSRPLTAFLKHNILGIKKLRFWYPQKTWQRIFWIIIHESSIYPAKGIDLLRQLVEEERVEAHLITARYGFLDDHLFKWLNKHQLKDLFKTINLNKKDEQPHFFKEQMIRKHDLDIFIEDNLDIVKHLHGKHRTQIYWIYNILDRWYPHPFKYPYLEKALENIIQKPKLTRRVILKERSD